MRIYNYSTAEMHNNYCTRRINFNLNFNNNTELSHYILFAGNR